MATLTNNQILDVLIIANVSKPNNFYSLSKEEWKHLCIEIKKDFGEKLTYRELVEVIQNGWKGLYDRNQFVINGFTIYKWIRIFLKHRPKKEIPCPKGIESFYWAQMSEIKQLEWLKNRKKIQEN